METNLANQIGSLAFFLHNVMDPPTQGPWTGVPGSMVPLPGLAGFGSKQGSVHCRLTLLTFTFQFLAIG